MTTLSNYINEILNHLKLVDPTPFFGLSLLPYLFFLYWSQKSNLIPKTSLWGFRLTLLFVVMTIILAICAQVFYGSELTDVDPLHGIAEAFLTLSDALVVIGFLSAYKNEIVKNS